LKGFWLTGDTNSEWKSKSKFDLQPDVVLEHFRKHLSLLWRDEFGYTRNGMEINYIPEEIGELRPNIMLIVFLKKSVGLSCSNSLLFGC
jgi:hypothetical protein